MQSRKLFRAILREFLEESKKQHGDKWIQGTKSSLMLDRPGMLVEPDVRDKIADYLKKMGLIK